MEHCMVDGKRCSKCCEVLTIGESKNFIEWRKYVRNWGYPDDFDSNQKIYHMLRKISRRRAKKKNPHLVNKVTSKKHAFFTCKNFTGSGCGIYENRPSMCSGYPYYGRTEEEWFKCDEFKNGALYDQNCTFYIELK